MQRACKASLLSACALIISCSVLPKTNSQNSKILLSLQKVSLPAWIEPCKMLDPQKAPLDSYGKRAPHCSAQSLLDLLQTYSAHIKGQFSSISKELWVNDDRSNYKKFEPFTQKLVVPAQSNIYTWGDLHGDIQALVRSLEKLHTENIIDERFKIKQSHTYFLFLGDYTDRGHYGAEVLYTILRLKIANPDKVILIRGNHEDLSLNMRFGFCHELKQKFPTKHSSLQQAIESFYNTLPVVLFLGTQDGQGGCNYLQCCHGGMEIGYHPHNLFAVPQNCAYERIFELRRPQNLKELRPHITLAQQQLFLDNVIPQNYFYHVKQDALSPEEIGFMWNDFSACGDTDCSRYNHERGCGLSYGQNLTETLLRFYNANSSHKLQGVIRAHQHNPSMPGLFRNKTNKGLYKLPWQTHIFTTVATQQYAPGLCTFLKITTAEIFSDWTLTRIHCAQDASWEEFTQPIA